MGARLKNFASLGLGIHRTQQRLDRASIEFVRRGGKIIQDQARLNAPVDTHDLENAITTQEVRDKSNRNRIVVEVGVDLDQLDLESRDGFDYALEMHEGEYKLGPKSSAKQSALGGEVEVGPKYLERAAEEHQAMLKRVAADILGRALP